MRPKRGKCERGNERKREEERESGKHRHRHRKKEMCNELELIKALEPIYGVVTNNDEMRSVKLK